MLMDVLLIDAFSLVRIADRAWIRFDLRRITSFPPNDKLI
jgi:hypothetical protein